MESIHKIPINEAFEENCGCPICRLYRRYEENAIRFLFEEGVMNPETRIQTNELGFCSKHADMLLNQKQSLSIALLFETRLQKLQGVLHAKTSLKSAIKEIERAEQSCYICNRLDRSMIEIAEFISLMYREEEFKKKFEEQEFFCLPHTKLLLQTSKLKGGENSAYLQSIMQKNAAFSMRTRRSLLNYAESFDYKSKQGSGEIDKNASKRAVEYLTGKGD